MNLIMIQIIKEEIEFNLVLEIVMVLIIDIKTILIQTEIYLIIIIIYLLNQILMKKNFRN